MILLALLTSLLSISITPTTCLAPCSVRLKLSVEPAADNEKVVLTLDSEETEYGRVSELPLNERSPRTVWITYPGIPEGVYTLTAVVWKHAGRSWIAATEHQQIVVRGQSHD